MPLAPVVAVAVIAVAAPSDRGDLESLVEAERAFARASVARGTRAAFLENLGPASTLFRPRPVAGVDWTREHPDSGVTLVWEPVVAEVAAAGDLGFTSGPYRVHPGGLSEPAASHGTYATVWVRQPDGTWKVRVDNGVPHAEAPRREPEFREPRPTASPDTGAGAGQRAGDVVGVDSGANAARDERRAALREELRGADVAFDAAWRASADATWRSVLTDDARVLRTGELPRDGAVAALELLSGTPSPTATGPGYWEPMEIDVASSGELGYTWGAYDGADESGYYLRVWRREDGIWRIVLDLAVAAEPAA